MGEGGDFRYDPFGLPPRRPNDADCTIGVTNCVQEEHSADYVGFSTLAAPSGCGKLVVKK